MTEFVQPDGSVRGYRLACRTCHRLQDEAGTLACDHTAGLASVIVSSTPLSLRSRPIRRRRKVPQQA